MSEIPTYVKDPNEKLDYTIDYSEQLTLDADTISSSAWTVESGVTVESNSTGAQSATLWLSGGVDGTSYTCTNRVTTINNPSRIYEKKIVVTVREQ